MHHIYHTEGLVIQCSPFAETNSLISVFTRDLGLIQASAQGVRSMQSKMRYALHDYSFVRLALVKGKSMWRLTNAIPEENIFAKLRTDKAKLSVYARILNVVRRLVAGEEKNVTLYQLVYDFGIFLINEASSGEELKQVESLVLLRVLYNLGYIDGVKNFPTLVNVQGFKKELLAKVGENQKDIIKLINEALQESQL